MLNIQLPSQEVILPVTGKSILVQPFTLRHKLTIAESEILTLSERIRFMCDMIFDRVVSKDQFQNNLDTFMLNIYEPDLDALLYGIVKITYRKPYKLSARCTKCDTFKMIEVPLENIIYKLTINHGGKDTFFSTPISVDANDVGLTFTLRLPTIRHVYLSLKFLESQGINLLAESVKADNLQSFALKIALASILPALIQIQDKDGQKLTIDHSIPATLQEAVNLLQQLPDDIINELLTSIEALRSKYTIEFGIKTICDNEHCESHIQSKPVLFTIDLQTQFFPIPFEKLL